MPRRLRPLIAGTTYHVTTRGNEQRPIARDDADWRHLAGFLDRVVLTRGWSIQSSCFMPNHLHLVVRTPEADLSDGMREVLGDYARDFNDRHDRSGHLFQGRFYSGEITSDAHHEEVLRYVALNPVRAGLAAAPELHRWSAHAALLGDAEKPTFLDASLPPFGGDVDAYASFVRDGSDSYIEDLIGHGGADRLRLAMTAGFSQREIGEALGVPQQTVSQRAGARERGLTPLTGRGYDRGVPRRDKDAIPTSRVARSAKLGSLAAGQAVRQMGTRAANLTRDEEAAHAAMSARQLQAAEQIVTALGTMKGAAMKVGQVLSFLDVGFVPEEHREQFQAKLAALRDSAPNVAFKDMRKVVESEYGEKLSKMFAEFDETPIAAASIGQVYRARLHDGRDVAVKVQYPGVAAAVRADMQNLGIILRVLKSVAPGLDVRAVGAEIRERIDEELDYELEAGNQRALARVYRNHPFVVIPGVIGELSRTRVMTTEFVSGIGFEAMKQLPQPERDRIGEIVFRFYFGSMYRHRQFSGDPHPGNMILLPDGRMAFLDFGLFKRIAPDVAEFELHVARLGVERRGEELLAHLERGGLIADPADYTPEGVLQQFDDFSRWHTRDAEVALRPEVATAVMLTMSDPRSPYFGQMRKETLPPDHIFGRRLEMLTLAVMSQLHARGNWHRVEREWLYGDAPVTALGRAEAEWSRST